MFNHRRGFAAFLLLASVALCGATQAQTCGNAPLRADLGTATPYAGGAPRLTTLGLPDLGASLALEVREGPSNAAGLVALSVGLSPLPLPQYGAVVYPAFPQVLQSFLLDAAGSSGPLFAVPSIASAWCGLEVCAQALLVEPSAQGGIAFTQGLRLGFGTVPEDFYPVPLLPLTRPATAVIAEDVNGDGVLDALAATSNGTSGALEVHLGRVAGGFEPALVYPLTDLATSLAIGDFDGNGPREVVVGLDELNGVPLSPGVAVYQDVGSGVPSAPQFWPLIAPALKPSWLAVADLDLDGQADIIAACQSNVQVLPGLGAGAFGTPYILPLPAVKILVEDLNLDGRPDLVFASLVNWGSVVALPGGGFGPIASLEALGIPFATALDLALVHLPGDNIPDLLRSQTLFNVEVLPGLGDGTFGAAQTLSSFDSGRLAVGDLLGNGAEDVVVVDGEFVGAQSMLVIEAVPSGYGPVFAAVNATNAPLPLGPIAIGDFDRDGHGDLLAAAAGAASLLIHRGLPSVQLTSLESIPAPVGTVAATAVDVNADGWLDLVAAGNGNQARVSLGAGAGAFGAGQSYAMGPGIRDITAADIDQDGRVDLIAACTLPAAVVVRFGTSQGNFGTSQSFPLSGQPSSLGVGDLDGDGLLDVVVGSQIGTQVQWLRGAPGTLLTGGALTTGTSPSRLDLGDLDADGDLDVAVACLFAGRIDLIQNLGAGSFAPAVPVLTGASPFFLKIGDLDGGLPDLVYTSGSAVAQRSNLGGFAFAAAISQPLDAPATDLKLADLDQDGRLDVLLGNTLSDNITVLFGGPGPGVNFVVERFGAQVNPSAIAVGDFDQNGQLDLAVGSSATSGVGSGTLNLLR
jgi:hypothetical protein